MVVPVADRIRLSHILADDLIPRIEWAYEVEQDINGLGAGYVSVGNGDPNGLVTKPEGYLFLDLTTPAVWQNQNSGTVWTQLGVGGGSGLPDPWTSDQTSGEVVATVDDVGKTPLTLEALAGQTAAVLVATGRVEVAPSDGDSLYLSGAGALVVTPPAGAYDLGGAGYIRMTGEEGGGDDTFEVDTYGTVTIRATEETLPNLVHYFACESQPFEPDVFFEILDHQVIVRANSDTSTDPFIVQDGNSVDALRVSRPDIGDVVLVSSTSPTDVPLIVFGYDAQEVDLQRWQSPDRTETYARIGLSGAIGTSAGEPADADIAPGECFRYFDPTNGAAQIGYKGKTLDGTVVFAYGPMGP